VGLERQIAGGRRLARCLSVRQLASSVRSVSTGGAVPGESAFESARLPEAATGGGSAD